MHILYAKGSSFRSPACITLSLIFLFNIGITVCDSFAMYRGLIAFPAGPTPYFTLYDVYLVDNSLGATDDFLLAACAFCADSLMLWRIFVVWNRDKRIIVVPILTLATGTISCIFLVAFDIMAVSRYQDPVFQAQVQGLSIAAFSTNIISTWYYTICICYKLWSAERKSGVVHDYDVSTGTRRASPYSRIIKALIQSGMLYSMTEAVLMLCIITGNTAGNNIVSYMDARIIGIATTLLLLQLHTTNSEVVTTGRSRNPTSHSVHITTRVIKHTDTVQHFDAASDSDAKDPEQGIELEEGANVQISRVAFKQGAGPDAQRSREAYEEWK
ncbi:hypothetical protein FRB93_007884 [Tulasnella sp. JGI-2019a]|nr:hypothetical protein FRB93_007884 [Tulasnella sp. JGI-2019a]